MKVLLTGATGFIGSYIMKEFRKAGHEVVGYDNVVDNTSIQMILPAEELAGIPLIQGDIRDLAGHHRTPGGTFGSSGPELSGSSWGEYYRYIECAGDSADFKAA